LNGSRFVQDLRGRRVCTRRPRRYHDRQLFSINIPSISKQGRLDAFSIVIVIFATLVAERLYRLVVFHRSSRSGEEDALTSVLIIGISIRVCTGLRCNVVKFLIPFIVLWGEKATINGRVPTGIVRQRKTHVCIIV
jgi:hypothetical protein